MRVIKMMIDGENDDDDDDDKYWYTACSGAQHLLVLQSYRRFDSMGPYRTSLCSRPFSMVPSSSNSSPHSQTVLTE